MPLPEVVRMATLTPALIVGVDDDCGSISVVVSAPDLVVLDRELNVRQTYIGGKRFV